MKHRTNIFWIIMGALMVLGLILAIAGITLGGTLYDFNITAPEKLHNIGNHKTVDPEALDFSTADEIKSLDFNLSACSFTIQEGDQFSITGDPLIKNEIVNGTWHVKTSVRKSYFSVLGHHISIPSPNNKYTITIPKDFSFDRVDLDFAAAEVQIQKLTAGHASISGGAGSADIQSLNTHQSLNMKIGAGDIKAAECNIKGFSNIKCGAGDIKLGNEDFVSYSNYENISVSCAAGSVDITGQLIGDNKLKCSMGDIDLILSGTRSNYEFQTNASLGDIDIDDSNASGEISHTDNSNTGELLGTLDLDCNMGDIDVEFQ